MPEFKIRKPKFNKIREGVPIEDWTTHQVIGYFEERFREVYKATTRRPMSEMLCYINQKNIGRLAELEPRETRPHPNQLFKEFIDWILRAKTMDKFRIWFFGKQDIMVDFLDQRAAKLAEKKVGSADEFEKMEQERIRKAQEYFKR